MRGWRRSIGNTRIAALRFWAFLRNQFGAQESGDAAEIANFLFPDL